MFRFSIDRGGTFTDVYAECPDGKVEVMKLLSEDPGNYPDAPREAIRRIMEKALGKPISQKEPLDSSQIEWIRMGTTVATNALLERKGERMALVISKGFKDLLHIGNQSRQSIFDLEVVMPEVLYDEVVEVEERVVLHQEACQLLLPGPLIQGNTGEKLHIWKKLDKEKLRSSLQRILQMGIRSLGVVLMHSYTFPRHEEEVGEMAKLMGFTHISLSSHVMPMARIVPRGYTACADAYLTPCINRYVQTFASGFKEPDKLQVLFMQSDGGLTPMKSFLGCRAILSGPAGGVVGYAVTTYHHEANQSEPPAAGASPSSACMPVVGFDMGGTSTDVSRFDGKFEHVFEATMAGVCIQAPQLDINTVAAGGGSRLIFRSGMFVVGPESAGANPGPVCYGKGGDLILTVTDANLCLGRLIPRYFPKIFGPREDQELDKEGTLSQFELLTTEVNAFLKKQDGSNYIPMSMVTVAMGYIQVANEAMCRPIRALTQGKGYDTSQHSLACFGGAGGQHACAIARSLGMSTIFVHRYSGILSAYGLALADVVHESQEPCAKIYEAASFDYLDRKLITLTLACIQELESQGFRRDDITTTPFLHLRYKGTDCALMCSGDLPQTHNQTSSGDSPQTYNHTSSGDPPQTNNQTFSGDPPQTHNQISSGDPPQNHNQTSSGDPPQNHNQTPICKHGDFERAFTDKYKREFGFTIPSRAIIVDDIRVRATAKACSHKPGTVPEATEDPVVDTITNCYFEDCFLPTKVHLFEDLRSGHCMNGPAIIVDKNSTILVEPACVATVTKYGDIQIQVGTALSRKIGTELEAIQLSIFSHRFMSSAEQMGRVLQRTSISTNIKERLDFSCAIFGPDGGLVANAPHIPVHLGAMQEAVQWQLRNFEDRLIEGDVILSNHPAAGGSHLPDLTVITPVFYPKIEQPVFFVASRGHHADIGGITPGSMPPYSKHLWEEGMCVKSFKLVKNGIFQEEGVTELLMSPGKWPNSSGTRNLHDNLSDLRAQVAANQKGISLIKELIDIYGLNVVQAYMAHMQDNAEVAVRDMLKEIAVKFQEKPGSITLSAEDKMDDGSIIALKISISEEGDAVFDFTGTAHQVEGNCNAPRAVTLSAIIYCLRCMVGHDVPLNQGCLKPVKVIIPEGSLLDPSDTAAVVGGNVLTSQRITDVVFRAFETCAASQGCMNNITFGDEEVGYYETVAGGSGAGPHWHGRSGIHTHMTNTRITDPEILERRYPVVLKCFHLNEGTGGNGLFNGGDGVIREMLFRRALTLSVLTERRVYRPYGLKGGCDGSKGKNTLIMANGDKQDLPGKTTVKVRALETFHLETPGGGGYGRKGDLNNVNQHLHPARKLGSFLPTGSVGGYTLAQESA